jgi:hypothetical protein
MPAFLRASAAFFYRKIQMTSAAIFRVFIGPYGLHAFGLALLSMFMGFLWVFNFTSFF